MTTENPSIARAILDGWTVTYMTAHGRFALTVHRSGSPIFRSSFEENLQDVETQALNFMARMGY